MPSKGWVFCCIFISTTKYPSPSTQVPMNHPAFARWIYGCALILIVAVPEVVFGGQGVERALYTVPNTSFIENPSGDSVVTVNDTSGSITTLQTAINNARAANPTSV